MTLFDSQDWSAIWLTLRLAFTVAFISLIVATPIAWWLVRTKSRFRGIISSIVSIPLVLPPTVLGFYLLILMGPNGPVGKFTQSIGIGLLPFSFSGIVIASILYSLPFAVQPIQNSMEAIGQRPLEAAATLRATPWDTFWSVVVPLSKPGFLSAFILAFAHTVGEFGIILMVGGNIAGVTRVVSVQIYNHVEAGAYAQAHRLAGGMILFSFLILLVTYSQNSRARRLSEHE